MIVPQGGMPCGAPTTAAPLRSVVFDGADYTIVAEALRAAIADGDYFSGVVSTHHAGFEARLVATLIVYRTPVRGATLLLPSEGGRLRELVPVWWEMHTFSPDGDEIPNDFELSDLTTLLIDC